jgi:hypothetical protein
MDRRVGPTLDVETIPIDLLVLHDSVLIEALTSTPGNTVENKIRNGPKSSSGCIIGIAWLILLKSEATDFTG